LSREILISKIPDMTEKNNSAIDNQSNANNFYSFNNLKNFDLSSNKCRFEIDDTFMNIMKNVDVEMMDICKNYEAEEGVTKGLENEFMDLIFQKQNTNRILY
jgi:hypothetical protein